METVYSKHCISFSISERKQGLKYAIHFKPEVVKLIKHRFVFNCVKGNLEFDWRYIICPSEGNNVLFRLKPIIKKVKNSYRFQQKAKDYGHMEFMCKLGQKDITGVSGEKCYTDLYLYTNGVMDIIRPIEKELKAAHIRKYK